MGLGSWAVCWNVGSCGRRHRSSGCGILQLLLGDWVVITAGASMWSGLVARRTTGKSLES